MTELILGLEAGHFFWLCVAAAVVGLGGLGACFVFLHRKRLMEDMPTSRIRSAPQGYVELEGIGRLMDGPPIIAPLTRSRCLWWSYRVEERKRQGRGTKWVTLDRGISDDSFWLEDRTGRCVVDPSGAKVIPALRQVWYGSGRRPDRGPETGGGWLRAAFCDFRYTELRIPPDHPVYVLGGFRTQSGGPDAFDEKADIRELLEKWKHDKAMMALLDVNKDGKVDVKEWEAARRMAAAKVRAEHVQRAVETPDLHIVARPRDARPFILSGITQERLVRHYLLQAGASLAASAAGGLALVYALTIRGVL